MFHEHELNMFASIHTQIPIRNVNNLIGNGNKPHVVLLTSYQQIACGGWNSLSFAHAFRLMVKQEKRREK